MATNIDNRIVKMDFQNSQFMKAAQATMKTLTGLNEKLRLTTGVSGFDNVAAAAKNVNLDPVSKGVDGLVGKFSAMQVAGVTALMNITNKAVDAGIAFGKSLTVDPILDGLKEYETKMNAIQTIMTNTASKGTTLTDINGALAELNKYSDQTIYNFAQMTDNIGKATAAGVGLEDSVIFVKGLANVAAGFGVDAMSMAGATQQMTQALASGTIRLQDWMSMENRGMGGQMVQDALVQTAKEMGVYVDTSVGFRNTLQDNWLSSEIFIKTMEKMANDQSLVDAATKVKTFTQLTDVMKEAVGSGWAMSWEHIIGNKNESTELFTGISNGFSNIVGSMADYRNNALKLWKDLGGRDDVLLGLQKIMYSFGNVLGPIYEAFKKVFDPWNGHALASLSEGFKNLASKLVISHDTGEKIGKTFEGVFSIIKILLTPLKLVGSLFSGLAGAGTGLIDTIFSISAGFGEWATAIANWIENSGVMVKLMKIMEGVGNKIGSTFRTLFSSLSGGIDDGVALITGWATSVKDELGLVAGSTKENFNAIKNWILNFVEVHEPLKKMMDFFVNMKNAFASAMDTVKEKYADASQGIQNAGSGISGVFEKIMIVGKSFLSFLSDAGSSIQNLFNSITQNVADADLTGTDVFNMGLFGVLGTAIYKLFGFMKELKEGMTTIGGSITKFFNSGANMFSAMASNLNELKGCLEAYQKDLKAEMLLKIASSIGILALSVFVLSKIESDKLLGATAALIALGTGLAVMMKVLSNLDDMNFKSSAALFTSMLGTAVAINILASALKKLGGMDWGEIGKGLTGLVGVMTALITAMAVINKFEMELDPKVGIAVMGLATGLVIMSGALYLMSRLSWTDMAKGLAGVAGSLVAVGIFSRLVKDCGNDVLKATLAMNLLATALLSLAGVLFIYSLFKIEQIAYAGALIGALMIGVAGFAELTKSHGKQLMTMAASMLVLSISLSALSGVLMLYSMMPWSVFIDGMLKTGIAIGALALALKLLPKDMAFKTAGMLGIALALRTLTVVLITLGGLSWGTLFKGLAGVAGLLAVLAVGALAAPAMLLLGAALTLLSVSIFITAAALAVFAAAMAAAAGSAVAGAAALATGLLSLAAVFPVITAAIALGIVSFITTIGYNMPALTKAFIAIIDGICEAIITNAPRMAAAFATSVGSMLTAFITLTPLFMEAIATFVTSLCDMLVETLPALTKVAAEFLTSGLRLLCDLLISNADIITEAIANLIVIVCQAIIDSAPKIIEMLVTLIQEILVGLTELLPTVTTFIISFLDSLLKLVFDALGTLVSGVIEGLIKFVTKIIETIGTEVPKLIAKCTEAFASILDAIATFIESAMQAFEDLVTRAIEAFVDMVVGICDTIAVETPTMITAVVDMILAVAQGIADNQNRIIDKGADIIIGFVNGLADTVETKSPQLRAAVKRLMQAIVTEIKAWIGDITGIGGDIVQGLANGISGAVQKVKNAAASVAKGALNTIQGVFDSHSPSRETMKLGRYVDDGLALGIEGNAKKVNNASSEMANGALEGMRTAMASAGELFQADTTMRPRIAPVVDLSNVQNGVRSIGEMLPSDYKLDMSSSVNSARRANSSMGRRSNAFEPVSPTTNNTTNETINHFTINGAQDPKAVANEVSKIIDKQVKRRNAVWA